MENKQTLWDSFLSEGTYPLIYDWVVKGKKYELDTLWYAEIDPIFEEANQKDLRLSEISKLFYDVACKNLEALKTEPCSWEHGEEIDASLQIIQKHIIEGNITINPNIKYTLGEGDVFALLQNSNCIVEDIVYEDLFNWFKTLPNWKSEIKETYNLLKMSI